VRRNRRSVALRGTRGGRGDWAACTDAGEFRRRCECIPKPIVGDGKSSMGCRRHPPVVFSAGYGSLPCGP
jgi:hypothetical protein